MRHGFVWIAAVAITVCASTAHAQLLYSFETGTAANPDGFGPNGGGVTIAQDTIGATAGPNSMKYSVVAGATFVGALTTAVTPTPTGATINNPPGITGILFDMTIPQGGGYTGAGFDVIGVTMFGFNAPLGQFGLQAQFAPFIHVDGKAPGTYLNQQIDLTGATNPLDFTANQTFNQIFTTATPGPNQLTPSGFQFFLNKSNDAPSLVYIDNVRVVPEPATITMIAIGVVGLMIRGRRR